MNYSKCIRYAPERHTTQHFVNLFFGFIREKDLHLRDGIKTFLSQISGQDRFLLKVDWAIFKDWPLIPPEHGPVSARPQTDQAWWFRVWLYFFALRVLPSVQIEVDELTTYWPILFNIPANRCLKTAFIQKLLGGDR